MALFPDQFVQKFPTLFDNGCQFVCFLCSQHGNACGTEVGNSVEKRRCGQMSPCVEYDSPFIGSLYVDAQLLFEDVYLVVQRQRYRLFSLSIPPS